MSKNAVILLSVIAILFIGAVIYAFYPFLSVSKEIIDEHTKAELNGVIIEIKKEPIASETIFVQQQNSFIYFEAPLNSVDSFCFFIAKGDSILREKGQDSVTIIKQGSGERRKFLYPFKF